MAVAVRDVLDHQVVDDRVAKIMSEDLVFVREKLLIEESVPMDMIDAAIAEYRRFMVLIVKGHEGLGMPSREVDEVWHTHILFTRDYARFCQDVFGTFVHHRPRVPSRPSVSSTPRQFFEAYRSEFGEPPAIWGEVLMQGDNCTPSTNCQPDPTACWPQKD